MPLHLPLESHPVDSCRVDWWSGTIKLHRGDYLDDLYAYVRELGHQLDPRMEWSEPRKAKHFATVIRHGAGIQMQFTPPDELRVSPSPEDIKPLPNVGLCSIEFTGKVFGSLNVRERMDLFMTLRHWPGFMRTTRIDCQITCLEPEVDARFLVEEVEAGRLWAVGFGKYQAYLERTLHGEISGAATLYLGGRESDKRYRGYEKGAEAGWTVPATRHELQARGEVADAIFRRLTDRGKLEDGKGPLLMTAEDATVRDALGTMVDFRDTSRWEGRRKPNRWAQSAPVPEWWERVLQHRPLPIEVEYRPPGDLRAAWKAMVDQYGRKVALEVLRASLDRGEDADVILNELYLDCASRCKRDDWQEVARLLPHVPEDQVRGSFEYLTADAAIRQEGLIWAEDSSPPS